MQVELATLGLGKAVAAIPCGENLDHVGFSPQLAGFNAW
jgi:hypothetical protein